jgi:hypothetical protein
LAASGTRGALFSAVTGRHYKVMHREGRTGAAGNRHHGEQSPVSVSGKKLLTIVLKSPLLKSTQLPDNPSPERRAASVLTDRAARASNNGKSSYA